MAALSDKTRAILDRAFKAALWTFLAVEVAAPVTDVLSTTTLKSAGVASFAALCSALYNALRTPPEAR